jgi:hypothetical protein
VDAATRRRAGDALRRLGQSPYAGSALHAPPLLLAALAPRIASAPTIGTRAVAPFVGFDVLAAFALFFASRRIEARRIVWSRAGSAGGPGASAAAKREASRRVASTPWTVAALSLANPLAIASCVACSCAGLRTAALAFLIFGAFAFTLAPIRPRSRGGRRSLRTLSPGGRFSPPITPRFQSPTL